MLDIIKFELKTSLKSKVFLTSLAIVFIIIIGAGFYARYEFDKLAEDPGLAQATEREDLPIYLADQDLDRELVRDIYKDYNLVFMDTRSDLDESIREASYSEGLIIDGLRDITIVYKKAPNFSMGGDGGLTYPIENYLENLELEKFDLNTERLDEIRSQSHIESKKIFLDKDNSSIGVISFAVGVVIYLLTLMNGQITSTSVAREKGDRTMELLITSTSARKLINGKVIASFILSMISLVSYGLAVVLTVFMNRDLLSFGLGNILADVDPMVFIIFVLFFTFGYLIYLYLFAALGATVSKVEDLSTALFPLTMIVIAVYFLSLMAYGDPEGRLMTVLSYMPFSSMYTMYARYALTDLGLTEVGISLGILLISTLVLSLLSIYIYRKYTLNYGNSGLFKFKRKKK